MAAVSVPAVAASAAAAASAAVQKSFFGLIECANEKNCNYISAILICLFSFLVILVIISFYFRLKNKKSTLRAEEKQL